MPSILAEAPRGGPLEAPFGGAGGGQENGVAVLHAMYKRPAVILSRYIDGVGYLDVTRELVDHNPRDTHIDRFTLDTESNDGIGSLTPTDAHSEGHFGIKMLFQGHKNLRGAVTTLMHTGERTRGNTNLLALEARILGFDSVSFTGLVFPGQEITYRAHADEHDKGARITRGSIVGTVNDKPVIDVKGLTVETRDAEYSFGLNVDKIIEAAAQAAGMKAALSQTDGLIGEDGLPTALPLFEWIGKSEFPVEIYVGDTLSFRTSVPDNLQKRAFAGLVEVFRHDESAGNTSLGGRIIPMPTARRMLGIA